METEVLFFYIVIGFFLLVTIVIGGLLLLLWNRRKYIKTSFLDDTGKWKHKYRNPKDIGKTLTHDGKVYKFNISKCTRDWVNRPVACYYVGNPEQMEFNIVENSNKKLTIGTEEITTEDFKTILSSKVISEMLNDDAMYGMLLFLLVVCIVGFIGVILLILFHGKGAEQVCTLAYNNQTIQVITDGVTKAIQGR